MEQGTSTIATFTGTLLRREHALGEKFIQLVFRDNDKDVLCVSTNPRAATLPVGQSYRVEGIFKQHGTREFIYNPKVALLKKHWRPIRRMMFVVIVVVCVAGLGSVAYMQQHGTVKKPSSSLTAQHAVVNTPSTTAAPPVTTSTPTPAATPASTTVATEQVTKKTTTPVVSATPPVATPAASTDDSNNSAAEPSNVAAYPSTPTGITAAVVATATDPDSVTVTWDASTDTGNPGIGGYIIFQDGNQIATVDANTTSYVDNTPVGGSQYSYTVEAYDATNTADVSAMSDASPLVTAP